jgi:hypothetical protein
MKRMIRTMTSTAASAAISTFRWRQLGFGFPGVFMDAHLFLRMTPASVMDLNQCP